MKFVDEALIHVAAGNGGRGCLSFRREKCVSKGGPDGGDGGDGGSVFAVADPSINTLVDFRHKRHFQAPHGQSGMGTEKTGRSGEDLDIPVPLGTLLFDAATGEQIGEITQSQQRICIAQGGFHGLGNTRFKSSTQRAPRKTTPGFPGEARKVGMELRLLADVGLVGLPNAGKSTLISCISHAKPKIADYPFTTLHPNLGVVSAGPGDSFVLADVPGLIKGASQGAGLGLQFLKHLSRTRLLLHLVDLASPDEIEQLTEHVLCIQEELNSHKHNFAQHPQWLVATKIELLDQDVAQERFKSLIQKLNWQQPSFMVSAVTHRGTQTLIHAIMSSLKGIEQS